MKNIKCLFWLVLSLFLTVGASAQGGRAVIYGKVRNTNGRALKIKYPLNDINGSEAVVETDLDANGEYALALDLDAPRAVTLVYDGKEMLLFLRPGGSLEFNFNNVDFYKSMQFDGIGFNDNSFLQRYILRFGMRDKFDEALILPTLSVPDSIFEKMNRLNPTDFTAYAEKCQKAERDFYTQNAAQTDLSPDFKAYLEALIEYRWYSYRFVYGDLRQKRQESTDEEFYVFLWDLKLSKDEATSQPEYGAFLDIYLNYTFQSVHGDSITNKFERFARLFELAEQQLSGNAEEYMLGRLLARNISPTNIAFITAYYERFLQMSVVDNYRKAVEEMYARALAFSDKQAAPTFSLLDSYGDTITLEKYQNKLVYLSFWASWCQPCIKEQEASLANRVALQEQDIVFVYISLDEARQTWQQFLERKPNYGINLWAGGRQTDLTRAYNVISLPHYFLLDRQGRFVTQFQSASSADFVAAIKQLLE
jgi:thiol-disulfide isomerase/thioredoxin